MKKLSKILALILVSISVLPVFTGCSNDEISLLDAMIKNQGINSMVTKTNSTIQLNVSGLPEDQQQQAFLATQILNNINITSDQKMTRDSETGTVKTELLDKFTFSGMSSYANIWVESGISNGLPAVKEIYQLPPFASFALPGIAGKDYIVLDTSKTLGHSTKKNDFDYSKYNDLVKEITTETTKFYSSYAKNLKPGFSIATYTGSKTINGSNVKTYQLKLSDSQFKELLNFIIKDLGTNKDNLKLIEDYITSIMNLSAVINPQASVSETDIKDAISQFESQIPAFIETYTKYSDALKDVKILGNDGIVVNYAVNNAGYIVNEDSQTDLNIDFGEISKVVSQISGEASATPVSGKISLKLNSSSEISKINENIEINLPEVNDSNSVDYFTLVNKMVNLEEKPLENDIVSVYVNGKYVKFNDAPVVINDSTMVPAREVIETLGGTVDWNDAAQTVTAKFGDNSAAFTMGSSEAIVNGEAVNLNSPAILYNNRVYIPLRVLSDSIGAKLIWDDEISSVFLEL